MFLFPVIYILFFLSALRNLAKKEIKGLLLFIIFGLPIYTAALSVSNMYGYGKYVPVLQTFKEICIICYLIFLFFTLQRRIRFHMIDKLMLFFFLYILVYVFLPLGSYTFFQRVLAFKSLCFFPVVYFTGRLLDPKKINLSEVFHYIGLLAIIAACVLFVEVITYTHLQTYTGYAQYNDYFFDQEPSGNYGLSWTFEIETGMKRFASFFSNPLEFAAATLISTSALAALATNNNNRLRFTNFTLLAILSTVFAITFALSRAAFVSYFIILYAYALITKNRLILKIFHYTFLAAVTFLLVVSLKGDFFDFIVNTVLFRNESSIGHVIEWLNGVESMILHPLGIGLGESGRLSASVGLNTGGENQFVIIGVQAGIIALAVYITVYAKVITAAYRVIREKKGAFRKLAIFIVLIKVGLLIPLFTAEVESYIYISYLVWFLTGVFVSMLANRQQERIKTARASLQTTFL